MHPYASTDEALTDVLCLSKRMSFKNSIAGLPLGGGKSVINADPSRATKPDLLRAFSRHVQDLGGRYWAASAANHALGRYDLSGGRVTVQGLGQTGGDLCRQLHEVGTKQIVADVNEMAPRGMLERFGATPVAPDAIHAQDVDSIAPSSMNDGINDFTLPDIKARAICGLANNQLAELRHRAALQERCITYVPDYAIDPAAEGVSQGAPYDLIAGPVAQVCDVTFDQVARSEQAIMF
ncbi:hypothetical protein KL867_19210 [Ruegeria litorea]|uniref:Glutamate/phenylalanine/leucine/valine/L-tryptophan dehydrogenase C-terminal domain-containing protein n=2 Tax=Falsiruegeria litorea TaxID=1280831 RepID=A0ABS5WVX3_9RHOB|nr:hypothetical protein [Falsiruegeria litorea]